MNATRAKEVNVFVAVGKIERLDPQMRELCLVADGALVDLLVPPDCLIFLNQERVKLRLLQAQDVVEVAYSRVLGVLIAHAVRVLPRAPAEHREKSCLAATS